MLRTGAGSPFKKFAMLVELKVCAGGSLAKSSVIVKVGYSKLALMFFYSKLILIAEYHDLSNCLKLFNFKCDPQELCPCCRQ